MAYRKQGYARYALPSNEDYWVELRRLSLIDAQAIQRIQFGELRAGGQPDGVAIKQVDSANAVVAILVAAVRGWNLDEELPDGTVRALSISEETLKDLEPGDMEFIVHTVVKGTLLEQSFGAATIRVIEDAPAEVTESPNGSVKEPDTESLFISAASPL